MNLYFLAWTASILFGVGAIAAKLTSKHSVSNPWLFNFFWMLFILVLIVPTAIYFGAGIPSHWLYIILGSICFALSSVLYTFTVYKLDASVLSPLWSFRTAMAVILGAVLLNEVLTTHQYFLIAIIFIFGMFTSIDEKFSIKSFFTRGVAVALVAMLAFTLQYICFNKSSAVVGYWNTALWVPIFGQILLCATIPFFKKEVSSITKKQYASISIVAFIGFFGTLIANAAYAQNISISSSIIALPVSMVLAFLFSLFAPEILEKHSLKVYAIRFIAAFIMIFAALNL